jgi:murein DD-endopeptidase MepM/ murein hydrolase activator NlpD
LKDRNFKISRLKRRYSQIFYTFIIAGALVLGYHLDDKVLNLEGREQIADDPTFQFGFNVDSVHIHRDVIRKNDFFGAILNKNGLAQNLILLLEHESRNVFNIRNIREGAKYHIIKKHECDARPLALVYEPDKYKYVIYDFRDSVQVKLIEREVEVCDAEAYGKIESTLWGALENQRVDPAIIDNMEDALSGAVDFYHTQKGDEFKLIYENKYIDGELVGIGRLIAASYTNESGTSHSILYKIKDNEGYFDGEGRPAQRAFLKAPVKFSRISSRYNLRRFHPIRGKTIPHLGTDYAAPHGTPIRSVSDGVVTAASYTGGNGNFVKIRHDNVYETQYLHMSRFAKGIRPGVRVKQGQTIGFVGSTGLATGPHVCFRFWKNGRQINHLREKLPAAKPMSKEELPAYYEYRDKILVRLTQIRSAEVAVAAGKSTANEVINP